MFGFVFVLVLGLVLEFEFDVELGFVFGFVLDVKERAEERLRAVGAVRRLSLIHI